MGLRRRSGRGRDEFVPLVEPLDDGGYLLNVHPGDREALSGLLGEMRDLVLHADPTDPRLRRLFPTAYHSDPDADAEYQRLMRDELVASRLAGTDRVIAALGADRLTADDLHALMQAVNSLRLVLGTMLDVGEDDDPGAVDDDDPTAAGLHLYDFLSVVLEAIVQAQSASLGEGLE